MALSFDPIKPYLTTIKWVLGAGLLIACFVGGCSWKGDRTANEIARIEASKLYYKTQAEQLVNDIALVNLQAEENKKAALDAEAQAAKAANAALKAKANLDKTQVKWQKDFEKMKLNPDCKAILETKLCPLIETF